MAATCFPYGFTTSHSRVHPALGRLWPQSVNAEPGTFGHECGRLAKFVGLNAASGAQACFCADCKECGFEARHFGDWHELGSAGQGAK